MDNFAAVVLHVLGEVDLPVGGAVAALELQRDPGNVSHDIVNNSNDCSEPTTCLCTVVASSYAGQSRCTLALGSAR